MKRALALVLLALFATGTLHAQETVENELEFVRKLRAKGYHDLAKEYLDKLQARKDPKLAAVLPLEEARTLLAVARDKDAEQRLGLFQSARKLLQDYVAKNAGKPEAAEGSLEIARLSSYEGQALLTRALREMDVKEQQKLARPAEAKFQQASKDLEAAIKILETLVADDKLSENVKKQLQQELTQARFDRGAILIDQARTYVDTASEKVNEERAKIIGKAKDVFTKLEDDENLGVALLANAWLMKIGMEQQAPDAVEKYYKRVIGRKEAAAKPAQRWVRLFLMQDILQNSNNTLVKAAKLKTSIQKLDAIQKEGVTWLKDFPTHVKTPEGQGVLWELANAYYLEAKTRDAKKEAKAVEALFDQAQKYYRQLASIDGDFSEKSNQMDLSISFERMGDRQDFRTFDDFYLKAQYEMLKMRQAAAKKAGAAPKDVEKLEQEWKNRLREVTKALSRAISLADAKTPIQKLDDARFYLTSSYLLGGDLYRAAVAGEALGQTKPPTRRAPAGAGYGIEAYAALHNRDSDAATRAKLRGLIDYVLSPESQKFWSTEPVTAVARYQLAMLHEKDKDYKAAVAQLEKLPEEFPGYTYAQGQMVFIAQQARAGMNVSDADKKAYEQVARKALGRMSDLPADVDPATATMYFFAKLEMPKFLYGEAYQALNAKALDKADAKYAEMSKYLAALDEQFQKMPVKLTQGTRSKLDFQIDVLKKYADLGRAEIEFRKSAYDKVLEFTKPVVATVKKLDGGKGGPIKMRDFEVTGDALGLALRAEVQKGNVGEAKTLLSMLKRLRSSEDDGGLLAEDTSARVVRNLLGEIASQVNSLKKEKDEAKLKTVVSNFTNFLTDLAKDKDYDPANAKANPRDLFLLAEAFNSLDQHAEAAKLYARFPEPKGLSAKSLKDLKEEELQDVQQYWGVQLRHAEALRHGKDYKKAIEVLEKMIRHPNVIGQLYADKELNLVLEDEGRYAPALARWNKYMKGFRSLNDPKMKEMYFEGFFYQVRCLYKYAKNDPAAKSKDRIIELAARQIVRLENTQGGEGWAIVGPRFQELIDAEPPLKAEYLKQKAAMSSSN